MLTSFVPPEGEVLVLINGAYGSRAKRILDIARRGLPEAEAVIKALESGISFDGPGGTVTTACRADTVIEVGTKWGGSMLWFGSSAGVATCAM